MKLFFLLSLVALAATQTEDDIINQKGSELFGPLDDDDANNTDATVTERQAPSNSGQPPQNITVCNCVPYNLCDSSQAYDPEVAGRGRIIPRAGDGDCPVRGDICCTVFPPKQDPGPVRNTEGFGPRCGIRNTGGIGRNNTSASAQFAEFPWVVGLFNEMDRSDAYIGAGALIRPQVVITVAHIAGNYTAENLWVRAGEWDLRSKNELYYHSERGVREIYVAEDFDYKTHRNDLAMLRLKQAFPINELINVVCLSASMYNTFDMNSACLANGWGQTAFSNNKMEPSPLLKKVDLKVIESQKCTEVLQQTRLGPNYTVHSSFICAIGDNGADMCQGDGGGPLACEDQGRYQLRGLVSYGVGCGVRNRPAVYTNINEFIGLIEDKLRDWDLEDDETNSL